MANIVLTRIDDRLIHGQVMTAWVKQTKATRIIIIDDVVAKDDFMKKVLTMAAPPGISVSVYNIKEAADDLKNFQDSNGRIVILAKVPESVERVINEGVDINEIIVGGMGAAPGRKKLYKNVSISESEKETFLRLLKNGVKVTIQIVPDERPMPIEKAFK
ncbi:MULTISPECIES: PTS system mannose/fructose/N-acetylgalactosamine-transporter subunit IIB [Tissierellales]|jgi:PTS system mannose-specific IIB component|uniref:PTS mannose/fructose/sorbose transporter subunit IIB n=1 Tax=Acidilutibacter cellobiosedens TaxID=2507161 RepID=A0A410Q9E1_9FIRM|nr:MULTISPECIES: PTS sugar transporter subunit IIB [Tissierellales]QAT60615.1 PTS mannose/fructose/sorbose transporter subunit IIB [Acidilutibacter cellobiosedens]SCL87190.1 Sorbose-specific phosphotransferase enzyme IIB component [Sporanaerobacter sp. PP17-6a]